MTVKELIDKLKKENQMLDVVFWNELLDDNYRDCTIDEDSINKKDLVIVPIYNG